MVSNELEQMLEEKGEEVYGCQSIKSMKWNMAGGGSHWFNYIIEFDCEDEQTTIWKESANGCYKQEGVAYYTNHNDCSRIVILLASEVEELQDKEWFSEMYPVYYEE